MPFRPGAAYTGGFGLRTHALGSPGHLGVDRGSSPGAILHCFGGAWLWRPVAGDWGSVLRLAPHDFHIEVQIGHSVYRGGEVGFGCAERGSVLPVVAGDLGLSSGVHTHTEVVLPYSAELRNSLAERCSVSYVTDEGVNREAVLRHCRSHGLDGDDVVKRLQEQVVSWGIRELWDHFAVRAGLPAHRRPEWCGGAVLLVDSRWTLQI